MKKIEKLEVKNKKVLVRLDLNVPLDEQGNILDNYRIKVVLPTIKHLSKRKAKVILISHLGKPSGKEKRYSLAKVAKELEKLLKKEVKFLPDCLGSKIEKSVESMKPGEIVLLENLRFYKEETENEIGFANRLAKLGDIYVNDAFSVCHRAHASVVSLPALLPSRAGLLLRKEVESLLKIRKKPKRPLVIIIGGKKTAKIESLPKLMDMADYLLLNGFLSETILIAKEVLLGRPFPEEKTLKAIGEFDLTNPKLYFPPDVLISLEKDWSYKRIAALGTIRKEERVYDIGDEAINIYSEIVKKAKTIFWAGPLGFFEEERFEKGTKEVGDKIVRNYQAFKVAGGGDTIAAIQKFKWLDKFDHISTGGSALLQFLCGDELPGIESLE